MTQTVAVDNRRTMCAHCSLRRDLPGFISREHAEGNAEAICSGELFPCHMVQDPTHPEATNRICLGAAVVAGTPLLNTPAGGQSGVYADVGTYIGAQAHGRRTNQWLEDHGDKWQDTHRHLWYGWWAQAPAGNWHYLMTTLAQNDSDSVYLFFDQCEQLFGPLTHSRRSS